MTQDNPPIDGLRLRQQEKLALLKSLEAINKAEYEKYQEHRKSNRYTPIHREALADIEHPGGSNVSTHVLISDLCSNAIGFITRSYLHEGTGITLRLRTCDDRVASVQGRVQRCEYYDTKVHRVAVCLCESIDPRLFVTEEEWEQSTTLADDTSWMKPRKALHIEPDLLALNAIEMMLDNAMIECTNAESIGEALDQVQINPYDLVLISDQSNQSGLLDAIKQLHAHGYSGPLIVISSTPYERDKALAELGVNTVIPKPVQLGSLMVALRVVFENCKDTINGTDPIYSSLKESNCSEDQLFGFIKIAKEISTRLDNTISDDDYEGALKLCKSLHAASAGFGYSPLSCVAGEVMQSLNASCSPRESACHIRRLLRVINRLHTRAPVGDTKSAA